jgi:hypothetical protein
MPRGRPFDGSKPGPGRPRGAVSAEKLEFKRFLQSVADLDAYRESFIRRAIRGEKGIDKILADRMAPVTKEINVHTDLPAFKVVVSDERTE